MEKRKFYSAKEIIMGTRNEYQKNERRLATLKNLVSSNDREVKDFCFKLLKISKNPELVCYFDQNNRTLRGMYWYLKKLFNMYVYGVEHNVIKKNEFGNYDIGNSFYKASVVKGLEEEFDLLVQKILQSDFANNVTDKHFHPVNDKDKDMYMSMYASYILLSHIYVYDDLYLKNRIAHLWYYSCDDCMYIDGLSKTHDDEMIYKLLGFQVPADLLSDYHKQVIENNPSTYKPIEICSGGENIDDTQFNLLISETDDKITLTKAKIRKR